MAGNPTDFKAALIIHLTLALILKMRKYLIYILLIFTIWSCKQNHVDGIEIGQTLFENQSYEQNKKLSKLITQTLDKNKKSLTELIEFDCGGGSGCYDLADIFVQVVYRMGETEFDKMIMDLNSYQKNSLKGFLDVGFEYGNYNGTNAKTEFPELLKNLTK